MSETKSKVRIIFDAFTNGRWGTMNYTREKAYRVWMDFWYLVIKSGFVFEKNDLIAIRKYCGESSYNPDWYGVEEGHYSVAVRCGNLTFAYAFEELYRRIPFIGIGLDYIGCWPRYSKHNSPPTMGRLVLGVSFQWQGEKVSVTSFNDEKKSLVACAYHKREDGYRGNIKKRFGITAQDFQKEMSKRRIIQKGTK